MQFFGLVLSVWFCVDCGRGEHATKKDDKENCSCARTSANCQSFRFFLTENPSSNCYPLLLCVYRSNCVWTECAGDREQERWHESVRALKRTKENIFKADITQHTPHGERTNTWQLKHYPFAFDTHDDPSAESCVRTRHILRTRARMNSIYVSRGALFLLRSLLLPPLPLPPFISTSFVDSIETWYITRRASPRVDMLPMHVNA